MSFSLIFIFTFLFHKTEKLCRTSHIRVYVCSLEYEWNKKEEILCIKNITINTFSLPALQLAVRSEIILAFYIRKHSRFFSYPSHFFPLPSMCTNSRSFSSFSLYICKVWIKTSENSRMRINGVKWWLWGGKLFAKCR